MEATLTREDPLFCEVCGGFITSLLRIQNCNGKQAVSAQIICDRALKVRSPESSYEASTGEQVVTVVYLVCLMNFISPALVMTASPNT
jgi:hypothetical protein